jgi:hypothetical protein
VAKLSMAMARSAPCVGTLAEDGSRSKEEVVLAHKLVGSAIPLDFCTLGGAERCLLPHLLPSWRLAGGARAEVYCVVCDGGCRREHTRLKVFVRQLQTLVRDTDAPLKDAQLFHEMLSGVMTSKLFCGATVLGSEAAWSLFTSRLLLHWLAGQGRVPSLGEVWRIAQSSGAGVLFECSEETE